VSAFGFGGTNAHVVLEEAPTAQVRPAGRACRLLVLSAKTETALAMAARDLAAHFRAHPDTDLGDASFTLLTGRQAFPYRLAVVCGDTAEAAVRLEGAAGRPEGTDLEAAAARRWLAGETVDAAALFAGQERRRIALPTYPFERHRYWIEPSRIEPSRMEPVGIEPRGAGLAAARSGAVQIFHKRPDLATAFVAPRGEVEERVAAVWREVLGVADVGVLDSFLELGGDSLLATRLMARLREELAVELPMDRLFAQPTVAAVAAAAVEARAAQAGDVDLARMLAEIGALSEAELEEELHG
jgi:acyl carrier protein